MMKIAYILPTIDRPNGWRNHARGLLTAMESYVEPILFVAADDTEAAAQIFPRYPQVVLPATQQAYLHSLRRIRPALSTTWAVVSRRFPDMALVHSLEAYPTGLVGALLATKLGKKHVITAHGTYGIYPHGLRVDRFVYRRVLRNTHALCPVSPNTGDMIRRYFHEDTAHLYIKPILNGNDYYKSVPCQEVAQRQPADPPIVLSVGAVKPRKGHHISIQAFVKVKKTMPSARYWIIGDAEHKRYVQQLQQWIDEHSVDGIEFLGRVSEADLKQAYRQASLFVLTPQQDGLHFEGFGLVYLEAGAFGLPVVGTRTGGVPAAIQHGKTGYIADPNDVDGLADAMLCLLQNPEQARQMGLANRTWAEELTWEHCARQQYQVYQELLCQ